MKRGTICNVVYTPVTPSVLHPLCSHEMRVCDIWADSINITSVLYQFCSASSMRPDIAHRLACCDNLSSRRKEGRVIYVYRSGRREFVFLSFPSLRNGTNEWGASLSKIKSCLLSLFSCTKCNEIRRDLSFDWNSLDFAFEEIRNAFWFFSFRLVHQGRNLHFINVQSKFFFFVNYFICYFDTIQHSSVKNF